MRYSIIIGLILMALFSRSQDTAFVYTYGGDSYEDARCIVPSSSGGFIIAGTTGSQQEFTTNAYVLKIDSSLNCSWYLNQGGFGVEQLSDVAEDADGNIIAVGYGSVNPDSGYDVLIMKLNTTGEVLWQRNIGGDGWQFADEVAIHPNGGYLLAGSNLDMINGNDALLLYLDSDGNVLNEFYFGGPFHDEFRFLAVHDSVIYAGGSMGDSDTTECSWTLQLDLNFNTIHADTLFTYNKSRLEYMDFHGDTIFTLHTYYIDSIDARGSYFTREEFGNLIWSFDGNNFEAREIRYSNNLIYLPGTNSLFGLGGAAASICLFHSDGYFLECPSFGDLGDDGFSAMSFNDGRPILVGESNSYSDFGDNDVYLVMLSDSMVYIYENYTFYMQHEDCFGLGSIPHQEFIRPIVHASGGKVFIEWKNELMYVGLYDLLGNQLDFQYGQSELVLSHANFPSNIYVLRITAGNVVMNQKIFLHRQ